MARGGPRNRAGRPFEEHSGRSERRGIVLTALPADGYRGPVPGFPLPLELDRELDVWAQAWRTPQAVAWSTQPWRWRTVALWVRWSVRMEDPKASAGLGQVVMRLADQIGLTPAGLKENGWKIAEPAPVKAPETASAPRVSARDRARSRAWPPADERP